MCTRRHTFRTRNMDALRAHVCIKHGYYVITHVRVQSLGNAACFVEVYTWGEPCNGETFPSSSHKSGL